LINHGDGSESREHHLDLIWRDRQRGDVAVWRVDLAAVTQSTVVLSRLPQSLQIAGGVDDLDADGAADLILRDAQTSKVSVWFIGAGLN